VRNRPDWRRLEREFDRRFRLLGRFSNRARIVRKPGFLHVFNRIRGRPAARKQFADIERTIRRLNNTRLTIRNDKLAPIAGPGGRRGDSLEPRGNTALFRPLEERLDLFVVGELLPGRLGGIAAAIVHFQGREGLLERADSRDRVLAGFGQRVELGFRLVGRLARLFDLGLVRLERGLDLVVTFRQLPFQAGDRVEERLFIVGLDFLFPETVDIGRREFANQGRLGGRKRGNAGERENRGSQAGLFHFRNL